MDRHVGEANLPGHLIMFGPEQVVFLNEQLDQAAASLGEHFDAVQILAVHSDGKATVLMAAGSGNVFTRNGMIHEYVAQQAIQRSIGVMANLQGPPSDDIF